MLSKFLTKHASDSLVKFVTLKRFAVLLRKLTIEVITVLTLFACVWLPFE